MAALQLERKRISLIEWNNFLRRRCERVLRSGASIQLKRYLTNYDDNLPFSFVIIVQLLRLLQLNQVAGERIIFPSFSPNVVSTEDDQIPKGLDGLRTGDASAKEQNYYARYPETECMQSD